MKGKYLRQVGTGRCYAWNPFVAERKDMVPWTGPLPWEKEGKSAIDTDDDDAELKIARQKKILAAIKQVPEEEYGNAPGKLPAPKVKAVSDLAGFKVSAEEIQEVMETLKGE